MIDKLIEIIGREASLFESFLETLEAQQRMLVKNDADGLNEITSIQREKMVESQLLDREREALIEKIKESNDIKGDLTVTSLLTLLDENKGNQLDLLRTSILDLRDRIDKVRNQNVMLLNRSREFIGQTMDMLSKINKPESGYNSVGANDTGGSTIALDRRA